MCANQTLKLLSGGRPIYRFDMLFWGKIVTPFCTILFYFCIDKPSTALFVSLSYTRVQSVGPVALVREVKFDCLGVCSCTCEGLLLIKVQSNVHGDILFNNFFHTSVSFGGQLTLLCMNKPFCS